MNKIESLEEVRRWKAEIYEEEKDLSKEERFKRHQERTKNLLKKEAYKDLEVIEPKTLAI